MPPLAVASYPRPVTTPDPGRARRAAATAPHPPRRHGPRPPRRRDRRAAAAPVATPTAARGDIHELLVAAVDEAARLLDADGAMVYLVDPATGHLRFAHDAGIRSRRSRRGSARSTCRSASGCSGARSPSARWS